MWTNCLCVLLSVIIVWMFIGDKIININYLTFGLTHIRSDTPHNINNSVTMRTTAKDAAAAAESALSSRDHSCPVVTVIYAVTEDSSKEELLRSLVCSSAYVRWACSLLRHTISALQPASASSSSSSSSASHYGILFALLRPVSLLLHQALLCLRDSSPQGSAYITPSKEIYLNSKQLLKFLDKVEKYHNIESTKKKTNKCECFLSLLFHLYFICLFYVSFFLSFLFFCRFQIPGFKFGKDRVKKAFMRVVELHHHLLSSAPPTGSEALVSYPHVLDSLASLQADIGELVLAAEVLLFICANFRLVKTSQEEDDDEQDKEEHKGTVTKGLKATKKQVYLALSFADTDSVPSEVGTQFRAACDRIESRLAHAASLFPQPQRHDHDDPLRRLLPSSASSSSSSSSELPLYRAFSAAHLLQWVLSTLANLEALEKMNASLDEEARHLKLALEMSAFVAFLQAETTTKGNVVQPSNSSSDAAVDEATVKEEQMLIDLAKRYQRLEVLLGPVKMKLINRERNKWEMQTLPSDVGLASPKQKALLKKTAHRTLQMCQQVVQSSSAISPWQRAIMAGLMGFPFILGLAFLFFCYSVLI